MGRIGVILPSYNESRRICATLRSIVEFMDENPGMISSVVVVDDCSRDNTVELAESFVGRLPLRVLMLPVNSGKWAALHAGLEMIEEDAVLLMDADGSAGIDQLRRDSLLTHKVLDQRAAMFGTRFHKYSVVNGKGPIRLLLSVGYRVYVRMLYWFASGKSDVDDMQCPFKLVHRSRIVSWWGGERALLTEGFSGDMELACCIDSEIYNVPIEFNHEKGGTVRFKTMFGMAIDTFNIAMRFRRLSKSRGKKTYLSNVSLE